MTVAEKKLTGAEEVRWNLGDLYASPEDPKIEQEMAESRQKAEAFAEKYRGKVASLSAAELRQAIEDYENILTYLIKLGSYSGLAWSTDTQNPALGKLLAKTQEHGNVINQITLFFELEWSTAPDEVEKLADDPALEKYRHYLKTERLNKPYRRSESEEQIMSELSMTGASGWNRYFGELMSNLRYPWDGEMVTQSEVLDKVRHPDREIRKKAADSVTGVLRENLHPTTFVFNMVLLEKWSQDKIRGYKNWVASRNLGNQISDEAVEAMVAAITSRYDIVARYYHLLKKLLGYDELYDYDRYAPLEQKQAEVTWSASKDMVLNAFGGFDERMAEIAEKFFDYNWIDAPPQPGKRGGAYSAYTSSTVHPYVFMNFTGKVDSVMTLAHELGHGVHQYLAMPQGELQKYSPITTAEMASTFGEMLVFDYLMAKESDAEVRLGMRMEKIASTFATVFRQISMNRFEDAIHNARREQGELTKDQLSEFWMNTQKAMFGDSLTLRDDYGIWWSYIPHFLNSPGYVYGYAFGELLVWALYARYKNGLKGFNEKYLHALSQGGSDWPHAILAPLEVNLQDPQFWHEGLGLLDKFVQDTEAEAQKVRG